LTVFQNSHDFDPPEQRSKKYTFIDFLLIFVTKFLCFLHFSQFLLLRIKEILNNREQVPDFEFNKVTIENVDKIWNKINIKKATGADGIPAKIAKNCKSCIAPQLTALVKNLFSII
jgi:hypothetical protein